MAITRNSKKSDRSAEIDAFGKGAELVGNVQTQHEATGAKSTLIRWKNNEELRDRIAEYSKEERYSVHEIILEALRRGYESIERHGMKLNSAKPVRQELPGQSVIDEEL